MTSEAALLRVKRSVVARSRDLSRRVMAQRLPGHRAPVPTDEIARSDGHDFGRLRVYPFKPEASCTWAPQRCPFGGICHTCPARVQARLTVHEPYDKYEAEARQVGGLVIRMPDPRLKRRAEPDEKRDAKETPPRNKHVDASAPLPGRGSGVTADPLSGNGQPLSDSERQFFEPRFGYDFSQVRLHQGPDAEALNEDLRARAFTYDRHIWLGAGEGASNRSLLAHELVHTIQQGGVPPLKGPLGEGGPSVGVTLAPPHTRATGIQRSVQEKGVSSPGKVLGRIARTLVKTASLPIPLQLYKLGYEFDPGAGEDLPSNAFVYTCKGGWIDMGHFFFTAAGASTRVGAPATWAKAVETEEEQQRERTKFETWPKARREEYFGRSRKTATREQRARRGTAGSAYTIEDLPSDMFGFQFGLSLRPLADIVGRMAEFFGRLGAVDASRYKGLKKMMVETLGTEDPEMRPRQHRSTTPVLLASARELCGRR